MQPLFSVLLTTDFRIYIYSYFLLLPGYLLVTFYRVPAACFNIKAVTGQAGCCSLQANWSFHPTRVEGLSRFESHFRPADTEVQTPISTGRFNYCKSAGFPSRCSNTNKSLRNGHAPTHTCRLFVQVTVVESVLICAETLVSNHTLTCSISDSLLQIFACSNMTGKQTNKENKTPAGTSVCVFADWMSTQFPSQTAYPHLLFKSCPHKNPLFLRPLCIIDEPPSIPFSPLQPPSSGVSLQPRHSHFTHRSPSCQESSLASSSSLSSPITLLHFFWTFSPWTCHHSVFSELSCPVIPSLLFFSRIPCQPVTLEVQETTGCWVWLTGHTHGDGGAAVITRL